MNVRCDFSISLTVRGPILSNGLTPGGFGVDAAVVREFGRGRPCLPGTLLKGKLREALTQLGETADLDRLFGRPSGTDSGNEPDRGSLIVEDLVTDHVESPGAVRTSVAIDHGFGSAKAQMLRVVEMPFLPGEKVTFRGRAHCYVPAGRRQDVLERLRMGLRWITQVGAERTTGFGRLVDADVDLHTASAAAPPLILRPGATALEVALRPKGALCISRHRVGNNLFESDDVLPGNMLAASIMSTAVDLGIHIPDFERVRFRHAFPTTGDSRPRVPPLSTVKCGSRLYDVSAFGAPVLLPDEYGQLRAPSFSPDWKDHGCVLRAHGWGVPARELRLRTAIDGERRTADKGAEGEGGKLFGYEMVHPITTDGAEIVWRTRIDLGATKDPALTAERLALVLTELGPISKTKARCEATVREAEAEPVVARLADGDALALVLETPTLLADPRFQDIDGVPQSGALDARDLLWLYREVWNEISGGALVLEHHFARAFLAGGNHMANRFQRGVAYDPWLLTAAGSVFVFVVRDAVRTTARLGKWFTHGLPLPQWAVARFGTDWRANPYRPENGFGEVAVHEPVFEIPVPKPINLAQEILS